METTDVHKVLYPNRQRIQKLNYLMCETDT